MNIILLGLTTKNATQVGVSVTCGTILGVPTTGLQNVVSILLSFDRGNNQMIKNIPGMPWVSFTPFAAFTVKI